MIDVMSSVGGVGDAGDANNYCSSGNNSNSRTNGSGAAHSTTPGLQCCSALSLGRGSPSRGGRHSSGGTAAAAQQQFVLQSAVLKLTESGTAGRWSGVLSETFCQKNSENFLG